MSQTRFVKHLVKYDGDYGKGELETRSRRRSNRCRRVDTAQDDPALIAFTSGTTGVPKGCVHFHRDMLSPCDTFAKTHFAMKPGDIVLTSAPIAFTFGLGATLLFPLRFGAATATIEQPSAAGDARGDRQARRHPPRHRADRLQGDAVAARRSTPR